MSRASVIKGKVFERELAAYLRETLGLAVHRTSATQQIQDRTRGHADLIGLPFLALEAKRTEALNIRSALRQAIVNAQPPEIPVVVTRRNRETLPDAIVALRLSDFIPLYRAFLAERGHLITTDGEDT
jgi:hypothetical protein